MSEKRRKRRTKLAEPTNIWETDLLRLDGMMVFEVNEWPTEVWIEVMTKPSALEHYPPTLFCVPAPNGYVEKAKFRDFPLQGDRVWIEFARQKFRCNGHCKKTWNEVTRQFDDDHRVTSRFKRYIEQRSVKHSFLDAADICEVDRKLVERVFDGYAKRHLKDYYYDMPRVLGLDEKYLKGRPKFVVGDVENRFMLDMQPTRLKEDITPYFEKMDDRHKVEVVCQDMYSPYRQVTKKMFKNAVTVVDKFHVVKLANEGVDSVRKMIQKDLSDNERIALKRIHNNLLARSDNPKKGVKFYQNSIFEKYPAIHQAYLIKERLYELYDAPDRPEAEKALTDWVNHMPQEFEPHFSRALSAVKNWRPWILRYFEYPFTNAYIETLNGLIDEMNRVGRGYKFETLRAKALLKFGKIRHVAYDLKNVPWDEREDILNSTYSDGIDMQALIERFGA